MASSKLAPLPADYARPSLAEFKAAKITHVDYETFFARHEAELRKHAAPVVADELGGVLELAPEEPAPALEPAPPEQPTLEAWLAAGYGRNLSPEAQAAAYAAAYEAEKPPADFASGELSPSA